MELTRNKVCLLLIMIILLINVVIFTYSSNSNKIQDNKDDKVSNVEDKYYEKIYTMYVKINPLVKLTFKEFYQECKTDDGKMEICSPITNEVVSYELINNDAKVIYSNLDIIGKDIYDILVELCDTAKDNNIDFEKLEITSDYSNIDETRVKETLKKHSKNNVEYEIYFNYKEVINEHEIINSAKEEEQVIEKKSTVTFDTTGGSKINSIEIKENERVSEPSKPIKEGYIFKEWQLNGKKYNFETLITENITLKAIWENKKEEIKHNEYTKKINIDFVQLTEDFEIDNRQELLNIYYTIISSGMNEFTFYCSNEYVDCINEVKSISNNATVLSQMNNFVNVYNSFSTIKTTYTTSGKITISIDRVYGNNDIIKINNKLNEIEKTIYTNKTTDYDKILAIHDYIVNNTKYNVEDKYKLGTASSTAIGVLFNKLATCNGYTDTAALLLDRLGIPNVRISTDNHIWNLVYIDGKWLHLDITYDDLINDLNKDILLHNYFLKTTHEIVQNDLQVSDNSHYFDKKIFNFVS